ncbi:MAG: BON domain-containing protein [Planctomycetaceae bacterium]
MYDPKLEVGFEITPRDTKSVQVEIERHLREDSARDRFGQIEVSLEGETATMRGTVASANDRSVAEALVLFEPGVRTVRNQLVVRPPVPPTPPLPQE